MEEYEIKVWDSDSCEEDASTVCVKFLDDDWIEEALGMWAEENHHNFDYAEDLDVFVRMPAFKGGKVVKFEIDYVPTVEAVARCLGEANDDEYE